jgi:hypothetical protein
MFLSLLDKIFWYDKGKYFHIKNSKYKCEIFIFEWKIKKKNYVSVLHFNPFKIYNTFEGTVALRIEQTALSVKKR